MENNLSALKDEVLFLLCKDAEIPFKSDLPDAEKAKFLRALILTRAEDNVEEKLKNTLDKYLRLTNEAECVDINKLKFKHNVAYTNNILNLNCDMIVLIADSVLENVNEMFNYDLDNELILKAGLEFKADLTKMIKANTQPDYESPYILNGYNLNAKNICKIIFNKKYFNLINFYEKNIKKQENYIKFLNILKNNINNLFNFIISNNLNSVAFAFNFNFAIEQNDGKATSPAIEHLKNDLINFIIQKNKKLKLKIVFNN